MKTNRLSVGVALLMAVAVPSSHLYAAQITVKDAVQNMQYSLATEWDQKDLKKQKEIIHAFNLQIQELQKSGMTTADIVKELKELTLTKQQAADLDSIQKYVVTNRLSKKEANKLIVDTMQKSSAVGTSWNPGTINWGTVAIVVVVAALVTAIVIGVIQCDRNPDSCKSDGTSSSSNDDDWGDDGWGDWYPADGGYDDCYDDYYGNTWC